MNKTRFTFVFLLNLLFDFALYAQELIPSAEGNADLYIVRTTSFGSALTFKFI